MARLISINLVKYLCYNNSKYLSPNAPSSICLIYKHPKARLRNYCILQEYSKNDGKSKNELNNKYVKNTYVEDRSFLVGKHDPDTFGLLSNTNLPSNQKYEENDGDRAEEAFISSPPSSSQKLTIQKYATMIKKYLQQKRLKEALDVLDVTMANDRVKPDTYIYSILISGCGRVGYTKKAFQLYNQMKKRALPVKPGTYTALFNACANSPWPADGLKRATHLKELMYEKGIELNAINYHSLIKAFGRCGDLTTAFQLVDEMSTKQMLIKRSTFNFLLQACVSDKNVGFRHALLVWRKILEKNMVPDSYSYNLMLRCIRDCGLGDIDVTKSLFEKIVDKDKLRLTQGSENTSDTENLNTIQPNSNTEVMNFESNSHMIHPIDNVVDTRPNLLCRTPHLGSIVVVEEIIEPEDRLMLVGGALGFLNQMRYDGVTPDIKTYTQLLDTIPSTLVAEKALIAEMKKAHVKVDIDFFNMLIKKRSMRFDYENARDVLTMITTAHLLPDIVTYGVLALGCRTEEEAEALLTEMTENGLRMNVEILGAMLRQACSQYKFKYVLKIMETLKEESIKPNTAFIRHLNEFQKRCSTLTVNAKKGEDNYREFVNTEYYRRGFKLFNVRYKTWLEEIKVEHPNLTQHPWEQFSKNQEDGFEPLKVTKKHLKTSRYFEKPTKKNKGQAETSNKMQN